MEEREREMKPKTSDGQLRHLLVGAKPIPSHPMSAPGLVPGLWSGRGVKYPLAGWGQLAWPCSLLAAEEMRC